jgi:hypothetical protein
VSLFLNTARLVLPRMMTLLEKRVIEEMERLTEKGEDVCEDALRYFIIERFTEKGRGVFARTLLGIISHKSSILGETVSKRTERSFSRSISGILSYGIRTFGIQRLTEKGEDVCEDALRYFFIWRLFFGI